MKKTITILSAAAAVMLLGCGSRAATTPIVAKGTPVRMQAAGSGPASPSIDTNGLVVTKDEMKLSFKVGGVIRKISVEQGQEVKAGQRLAEIELTEINAQLEQWQQNAAKAQRDLQRGENLYKDQVISLEQLQDLRTQSKIVGTQLAAVRFNRSYSVITAPRAGVVLRKLADERELVPAGQAVLIVGSRERGYVVRAALSDREIVQLKLGDTADIRMDAFPGRVVHGLISEIASAAEQKTGLFPVEVKLEAVPVQLINGLVARLSILPAAARASTLTYVPIAAVVEGDKDRASIFVVDGDHARRRAVQIAFITSNAVAIVDGVKPGERVVTEGALFLEDGEQIEIIAAGARA